MAFVSTPLQRLTLKYGVPGIPDSLQVGSNRSWRGLLQCLTGLACARLFWPASAGLGCMLKVVGGPPGDSSPLGRGSPAALTARPGALPSAS